MPTIESTFEAKDPFLHVLLKEIDEGKIQLPDFQRGWVWDDDHIRSLVASVTLSYPIGAVMMLETGGNGVQFKPRLVEGVYLNPEPRPEKLILDGQQRLTSLYMTLRSGQPVQTRTAKGDDIQRVYFLDINKCLDEQADRLDAVLSIDSNLLLKSDFGRKIDLDLTTRDKEYQEEYFPLALIFDATAFSEWKMGYQEYYNFDRERIQKLNRFERDIWLPLQKYKVPVIQLLKDTDKVAVCQVFEKVNTGGVALTIFELLTATYAADGFELPKDWERHRQKFLKHRQLHDFRSTDFMTAVTLLASYKRFKAGQGAVSCKRKDVLNLTLAEYKANADAIESGLIQCANLFMREKIFDYKMLPYDTQLIPLSAICAVLGDQFENNTIKQKLARWYWCGVFGELYGGSNETRYGLDIQDVVAWIEGGELPRTVQDAYFSPTRLLSLQTRNSAAYKGLMALLMQVGSKDEPRAGSEDFISGDPIEFSTYFEFSIDIHHIFPRAYCEGKNLSRRIWNSVINKAPLSYRTNRTIGGHAPSVYLDTIEKRHNIAPNRLDGILTTHLIDPALLRSDAFDEFIRQRAKMLLDLIERAMGKPITGRDSDEVLEAFGGPLTQETIEQV